LEWGFCGIWWGVGGDLVGKGSGSEERGILWGKGFFKGWRVRWGWGIGVGNWCGDFVGNWCGELVWGIGGGYWWGVLVGRVVCGELVGNWCSLLPYLLSRLLNDDLVFSIALSVK
jgi:hypothetical protein